MGGKRAATYHGGAVIRTLTQDEAQAIIERIEGQHKDIRDHYDDPDACCRSHRESNFVRSHGGSSDAIAAWSEYSAMRFLTRTEAP
jgi:hypothetical protein